MTVSGKRLHDVMSLKGHTVNPVRLLDNKDSHLSSPEPPPNLSLRMSHIHGGSRTVALNCPRPIDSLRASLLSALYGIGLELSLSWIWFKFSSESHDGTADGVIKVPRRLPFTRSLFNNATLRTCR